MPMPRCGGQNVMSDDAEFREAIARDCGDALVDLWIAMAEALSASNVVDPTVLQGALRGVLNHVAATRPNSIAHYALNRAYETYMEPGPDDPPPNRPVWFSGVVDGGKKDA